MAESDILITYDGGDAHRHSIDAKLFGQSLQGLDRMVSDCLIVVSQERLPKRGERAPVLLKAKELTKGSVTVPAALQEASQLLGIGVPILTAIGPEIVSYYVSAVLDHFQGKGDEMETAIREMAEMHKVAVEAMLRTQENATAVLDRADERRHLEAMGMQDLLRTTIAGSGHAAADYVAPVGISVDTATFVSGGAADVKIDKQGADEIRESQRVDWSTPRNEIVTTDGFKYHTSSLSIENPVADGFLMAEVNDPVFELDNNPYTKAAQDRAKIEVLARFGHKNGKLARIMILDFVRRID